MAVLVSTSVARVMSPSVYDFFVEKQNLPIMPQFSIHKSYKQRASDIMDEPPVLTTSSTYVDCVAVLAKYNNDVIAFANGKHQIFTNLR